MITKKTCPKCGSQDVNLTMKGMMELWTCRSCGFTGNMISKPIIGREQKNNSNNGSLYRK